MGLFILIFTVYIVGGLTLLPLLLYAALWINELSNKYGIPLYIWYKKQSLKKVSTKTKEIQEEIQSQHYKVGWLRVSRSEEQSAPDTTIGDIVVSYISGKKSTASETHDAYAVLKYNTLYLYDSEEQLDCKEVILLDKYVATMHPPGLEEFELFTKLPLIKLTHQDNEAPYYFNCTKCIEKEDWYFSLIRATRYQLPHHSAPQHDKTHFDQSGMNHLITTVHSSEHHFQTQWFNALLGRLFFGVYKTDGVKQAMLNKVITKIDKINSKRPPFLGEITVRSVDPGNFPPHLTQPKLLSLSPTGEFIGEAFFSYKGGLRIEISTELKWKYSDRLKPLTMDIVLGITLQEISGKAKLIIKEPPTNRFWYGFYEQPKMEWKVEPVVWEKRVGYSVVVKAIQQKIGEFINETMVVPNFDDVTFFPTDGAGGIFEIPPGVTVTDKSDKLDKDLSFKSLPALNTAIQNAYQDEGSPKSAATAPSKLNNDVPSLASNADDIGLLSSSPDSLSTISSLTDSLKTVSREPSNESNSIFSSSIPTDITNKQMKTGYSSSTTTTSTADSETTRLRKSTSGGLIPEKKTASIAVNISPATAHKIPEKKE